MLWLCYGYAMAMAMLWLCYGYAMLCYAMLCRVRLLVRVLFGALRERLRDDELGEVHAVHQQVGDACM